MTTQISQTGLIDLDIKDARGPVIDFPAGDHFVEVKITGHLSLLITTAAEAQELEFRFAAARHYLSDEPEPAAGDLDDSGDDITDALVPDVAQPSGLPVCDRCGSAGHPMDEITNSHAPGGKSQECHDLHDCHERAAVGQVSARELVLEIRDQEDGTVRVGSPDGMQVALTPALGEDYWQYRVMLSDEQAIVGFPKFFTIGIGFAVEDEDWNTNFPYTTDAEETYEHIKANKGDDSISREDCIAAIRMIQQAATR